MIRLLASFRYLVRHPWLAVLSVTGIALGVAVVVSIDLVNASAQRAFELSAARVTGQATHHVVSSGPIDDSLYRYLRVNLGVHPSAPIIEGYASRGGQSVQILGIDPFADRAFRPYSAGLSELDLQRFLSPEPSAMVPPEMGLALGDTLQVRVGAQQHVLAVSGVLESSDELGREAAASMIVVDIGTAQRLFGRSGSLTRIDLILKGLPGADREAEGMWTAAELESRLPDGIDVVRSGVRTQAVEQMTEAFELNLRALSLLALVVAMFLIYNTMTFAVVQRRGLIGRLRAVGLTRREIFSGILIEAAALGVVGTLLGLALGYALSQGLVRLVTQTINDLYYVLEVRSVAPDPFSFGKGVVLGIGATLLAALAPAREAASRPVTIVMQRSEEERRILRRLPALTLLGVGSGILGALVLAASGRNLGVSYGGLVLILLAFALLVPAATLHFSRAMRRLLGGPFGLMGRMAAQGVAHHLSRTSVAIAALGIAIAASIGVGVMVGSFRTTVENWLGYTLQADLYIQPRSTGLSGGSATLPESFAASLRSLDGVRTVSSIRRVQVLIGDRLATIAAIQPGPQPASAYRFAGGDPKEIWREFSTGAGLIVSEPFAFRHQVSRGDSVLIPTDRGSRAFRITGVYYDYGSDQGTVLMSHAAFKEVFDAEGWSGISVYAERGESLRRLEERVLASADASLPIVVRSNRALRAASLEIFDRTFAITTVLRALAILVAFAGVVSALMALQIERGGEFGILRAEGMTPGQLRRLVGLQTGVMGTAAGVFAIPLGIVLALVLVYVINKRSFGWTLQFSVPVEVVALSFGLAVLAALLAGVYPAWTLSRADTAAALRDE